MKHLTPQELIDLPGYGRAEMHMRATGRWEFSVLDILNRIPPLTENDIQEAIMALENEEHK